jgi:hypothetical protein
VTTHNDLAVAAGHSVNLDRWLGAFDELMLRVGSRFGRVEPRRRARVFVLGLLAELPRKTFVMLPRWLHAMSHHMLEVPPGWCWPNPAAISVIRAGTVLAPRRT